MLPNQMKYATLHDGDSRRAAMRMMRGMCMCSRPSRV